MLDRFIRVFTVQFFGKVYPNNVIPEGKCGATNARYVDSDSVAKIQIAICFAIAH